MGCFLRTIVHFPEKVLRTSTCPYFHTSKGKRHGAYFTELLRLE